MAAPQATPVAASAVSRWLHGPTGPKTVHFWGPAAKCVAGENSWREGGAMTFLSPPPNTQSPWLGRASFPLTGRSLTTPTPCPFPSWSRSWGLVVAAFLDMRKPADQISVKMTGVLTIYSLLFMRFAWMVTPRNYLLLACHTTNAGAQMFQLSRALAVGSAPAAAGEAAAVAAEASRAEGQQPLK
jgi:hypothetical protein